MNVNRREFVEGASSAVVAAGLAANALPANAAATPLPSGQFSIDAAFAEFMRNIGESPNDGGGTVTFTGSDPILRSHFRIGACMAIPAMAAGVGAAAIWKERTGVGQDAKIDLREAIYNVNPAIGIIMQKKRAFGLLTRVTRSPKASPSCLPSKASGTKRRWFSILRSPSPFFRQRTGDG